MNLDERARRAAASLREQAAAVDAEAVLERIRGTRDRPRWLLPAGAAVAVALVIAVVAVVIPRVATGPVIDPVVPGSPTPTDEPTEPSPTEPTDSGEGTGPPVDLAGAWERAESDTFGGPGDQRMVAAARATGAYVAVGSDREGAAIWARDPRGGEWTRVAPDLCGEASCLLHDVTVSDVIEERLVAVGSLDGLPKVWWSEDGRSWQRVDLERRDPGASGETELTAVVDRGPDGLVAFGAERSPEGAERPVVFTSADGSTWTEAPVDFRFDEAGAHVVDAAHVGHGRVLAVVEVGDATVLLEEGEGGWVLGDLPGEEFGIVTTFVHAIATGAGSDLWMVGSVWTPDGQDGRVWRSTDGGITWTPMPGDLGGPGDQHVTGVALGGAEWLAVGFETDGHAEPPRPVAWALGTDGWKQVDGGPAFDAPGAMMAITQTFGYSALVVGDTRGTEGSGDPDAAVWTVEYDVPVREGCSTEGHMWESLGGRSDLPAEVEDVRQRIWDGAVLCDLDGLGALALEGPTDFTYSFGEDGAPAAYWRREEERGGQPMLELARLLEGPSATVETDDLGTIHVWPAAYASDDSYLGYRVGITDDGDWVFFVAGD